MKIYNTLSKQKEEFVPIEILEDVRKIAGKGNNSDGK